MSDDARFEDGGEAPLRLRALDGDDLKVISALVQDAVFPGSEMRWEPRRRTFALLLNRFRWEDAARRTERVRSVLSVHDVQKIASQGIERASGTVYALLSLDWTAGEDGTGRLTATLAGDGALALDVEALEVTLTDVTRPYSAPSGHTPSHRE
jgi:hypothetical protein